MYDVGRIRRAALAVFDVRPGPASALVLLRAAEKATEGLAERRDALSALIAYEGAGQYDKDAERYRQWLAQAIPIAEQSAEATSLGVPTSPLQARRYGNLLVEMFTGGVRAGASHWAALANQMSALEDAEEDVYRDTSWMVLWWAQPAANLAAEIGDPKAYDVQGMKEDFAKFTTRVKETAEDMLEEYGLPVAGLLIAGVALWFGWPLIAPALGLAASAGGPRRDD